MRFLRIIFLCLLCSPFAFSQSKPVVQPKGNFGFTGWFENIVWHKYLEHGNKLLLLSYKNLQILDVANAKVIESRPVKLPPLVVKGGYNPANDWIISPDGRKMLVVGHPDAMDGTKQVAWVWDLEAGKRIAVLDKGPDRIRSAVWSKNGKTIVTFDNQDFAVFTLKLGVSFWDGESFEFRKSISVDNITWWHLSDDGERFFASTGKNKSFFGLKYVSDKNAVINVWDTRSGAIEKVISVSDGNFSPKTREISVSPDEKFLVFVNKHKSNDSENRLLAWEMNGSIHPKYEIKAQPQIDDSRIVFSPDGKYYALDVGKNLQIYETETGAKRFELQNVELPQSWLDNEVLINIDFKAKNFFETGKIMEAFDATNGQRLYYQKLEYREVDVPDVTNSESNQTEVVDDTFIVPHPFKKIFVTHSKEYVKIFDSRTGQLLQTVISPPIDYSKKKPKIRHGDLVLDADWSADGKTLYIFSADRQTVLLYGLIEN